MFENFRARKAGVEAVLAFMVVIGLFGWFVLGWDVLGAGWKIFCAVCGLAFDHPLMAIGCLFGFGFVIGMLAKT